MDKGMYHSAEWKPPTQLLSFPLVPLPIKWNVAEQETKRMGHITMNKKGQINKIHKRRQLTCL